MDVDIEPSWGKNNKISQVRFKFSPEVWADIANKEGELLPMCCANISAIRDQFVAAMREDYWMTAEQMEILVVNMSGHEYDLDHPVTKVADVYNQLIKHLDTRKPSSADPNDLDGAVNRVWFSHIWKFCAQYGCNRMYSDWGSSIHECASHNRQLFEVIPVVKTLYDKLLSTGFPPIEGYALVRKANNQIYEFPHKRLAILPTKEDAEQILESWIKSRQVKAKDVEIRTVRASVEKGIEFIARVNTPWSGDSESKIDPQQHTALFEAINKWRSKNDAVFKNDYVEDILLRCLKELGNLKG